MRTIIPLLALFSLLGCSSPPRDAPAECAATVEAICEANASCAVLGAPDAGSPDYVDYVANCKAGFATTLDCSRAARVTGNPDACKADIAATPCALYVDPAGLPVPASCKGLFSP